MSKGDRSQGSIIAETSYGVAPNSNMTLLRFNSESFERNANVVESDEVTSDGQIADQVLTSYRGSGDLVCDFTCTTYDELFAAALRSAGWSVPVTVTGTGISAAASDNSFNDTGNGFGSIVAGQWIKASSFTNASNNGYFKVVSATASKIVVAGKTLTNESAGSSRTIKMGSQIVNGTTTTSFALEFKQLDLSSKFKHCKGQTLDGFDLDLTTGDKATITWRFKGKSVEPASAALTTGSYAAATTTTVLNVVDNMLAMYADVDASNYAAYAIRSLKLVVSNQLREQNEAGQGAPTGYNFGQIQATGQISNYKIGNSILTKFGSHATVKFAAILEDAAGNAYVIEILSTKLTKAAAVVGGRNSDVMDDVSFAARRDPSEGITIRVTRFP